MIQKNDTRICLLIEERRQQGKKLTITLDYGVHHKKHPPYESVIWGWADKGFIDVKNTDETLTEFRRLSRTNQELANHLEPQISRYPSAKPRPPALFGVAAFNEVMFNDQGSIRDGHNIFQLKEIFKKSMFPNYDSLSARKKRNADSDASHVACHYILYRDIFLTNDRHFERAINDFGNLIVTTPESFIKIGKDYYKT